MNVHTLSGFKRSSSIHFSLPIVPTVRGEKDSAHTEIQVAAGGNNRPLPECAGCVGCARSCGVNHTSDVEIDRLGSRS